MSEYVSMRSIQLKNAIMLPEVLQAYRSGNLDYAAIQGTVSPLREIYLKTYDYINYPELSNDARGLIALTKPIDASVITAEQKRITDANMAKMIAMSAVGY